MTREVIETKTTLRTLREECGKSVLEVADFLAVSYRAVYRYECGTRQISLMQVLKLEELYECTAEEIIKAQLNSYQIDR